MGIHVYSPVELIDILHPLKRSYRLYSFYKIFPICRHERHCGNIRDSQLLLLFMLVVPYYANSGMKICFVYKGGQYIANTTGLVTSFSPAKDNDTTILDQYQNRLDVSVNQYKMLGLMP